MADKLKLVVIIGTRPEAIKMAPVIMALNTVEEIDTSVCVTAQHRDMLDEALAIFDIKPDYDLNLMRPDQSLEELSSRVLLGVSELLKTLRPDRVLVHGDTTTTFAAALAAFYCGIPVGHVEAGLRTGNLQAPWPEEFNRCAVDTLADLLWPPTEGAAAALKREGIDSDNIFITGNTVVDTLLIAKFKLEGNPALTQSFARQLPALNPAKKLVLVTGHRRENFNAGLGNLCKALNQLASHHPVEVIWPVHPNPNVRRILEKELQRLDVIHLIEPQGYLAFVSLMMQAAVIITDSGGIQEEAPVLGVPVLVTRTETERPEAIKTGAAQLVGADTDSIYAAAVALLNAHQPGQSRQCSSLFGDGHAAVRIVNSILTRHGKQPVQTDAAVSPLPESERVS